MIGRLADRYGKLPVYRIVAVAAMGLILVVTNLPRVPLAFAVGVVGTFMLTNAGRMVAALAMVTGSVERRLRGGFMSARFGSSASGFRRGCTNCGVDSLVDQNR